MPTGNLPASAKKIWENVYNANKGEHGEAKAAKMAYGAIKNAGWSKDEDGNWHKKSSAVELSMHIERASYTKEAGMKWRATASDVGVDKANDEMSLDLYNDFVDHISLGTQPPEEFCSDFWKGGMPYVSLSHYPDLNGDAVPGMTESVWIDGDRFKAKGSFLATPLGEACFKAVKLDTSGPPHPIGPVRISIAFLDYGHIHKSNNFKFIRNDEEDYCEECLKEFMNMSGVGKRYIKGHLIHLAMTRVPMNERTDMEVEKSMTTRKEDALSIVEDEELIEPIEEKAKLVGKSELVIKADEVEEAKHGKEDMPMHDEEEDDEEEAKKKKKEEKKSDVAFETVVSPVAAIDFSPVLSRFDSIEALLAKLDVLSTEFANLKSQLTVPEHPLDTIFEEFKRDYDQIQLSNASANDKLQSIQAPFNKLGGELAEIIRSDVKEEPKSEIGDPTADAMVKALSAVMSPIAQKLDMLLNKPIERVDQPQIPQRRSIQPPVNVGKPVVQSKAQYSVSEIVNRTT